MSGKRTSQLIAMAVLLGASAAGHAQDFAGENGRYKIVSRYSGKAIDVSGVSTSNGAPAILWSYLGGSNQQWDITSLGNGYYSIRAAHTGKALDVYNNCSNVGCQIVQWDYAGSNNQQWQIVSTGSGYFKIVSRYNGMPLDVWNWNSGNGAEVRQYTDTGGTNQQWQVVKVLDCALTESQADLLRAHNSARATARSCGGTHYPAVSALAWSCKLATAAAGHNTDMAKNNFFSHTGSNGSQPADRATAAGYSYTMIGENIAAGYSTVASAMDTWLQSSGHCSNIMNGSYTEMGGDKLEYSGSTYYTYWTSVFGRR